MSIEYGLMKIEDSKNAEILITQVFNMFVAADFSKEGIANFYEFIRHDKLIERILKKQHQIIVAKDGGEIVGVIETRDESHICLLFVKRDYHKLGVAKTLIRKAFPKEGQDITVNSSPYATVIYEKLGFKKISGEIIKDGITYIPMIKEK